VGASRIKPHLAGRRVVFVGRAVAAAFDHRDTGWFRWASTAEFNDAGDIYRYDYAVVPHPSGRNRFWNCPHNTLQGEAFMAELLSYESKVPRIRRLRERARAEDEVRGNSKKHRADHSMSGRGV
jgi:hypothetical protein